MHYNIYYSKYSFIFEGGVLIINHQAAQKTDVSANYYFKQALSLMPQGNSVSIIQYIDSAIIFSSHSCFYIYQKIKYLFACGQFTDCSQYILEQIHFLYENASLYITCRALSYYQKINAASSDALKAILAQKSIPLSLADEYENILLGKLAHLLHYAEKASVKDNFLLCIDYCALLIKKNHSNLDALYLTARAYHMLGNLHQACSYYKKCIELDTKYPMAYIDLGLAFMELGLFPEALESLVKASQLQPDNVDYLAHIAECYYMLKKYKLAQEVLEKILKLRPDYFQAYFTLSYIYKKQNKNYLSKKYMKMAKKALQM